VIVLLALGAALGCAAASTPAGAPVNVSGLAMRELAPVPLWSGAAPGALGDSDVDRPVVTPFLPPVGRATGTAVVVFAGGGYLRISLDKEAAQAARWLTSNGVAAFVVRYRLGPRYHHPAMLQDALRAVRVVRAGARDVEHPGGDLDARPWLARSPLHPSMRAFLRSCLAILRSAAPRSAAPIDVCMIGDSTMSERTPEEAERGWGQSGVA
jgi:hypothetical protein